MNCAKRMIEIAEKKGVTSDHEFARITGIPYMVASDIFSGKIKSVYTETVQIFCKAFDISISDFFQEKNPLQDAKYILSNTIIEIAKVKKDTLANLSFGEIVFCISDNNVYHYKVTENNKVCPIL